MYVNVYWYVLLVKYFVYFIYYFVYFYLLKFYCFIYFLILLGMTQWSGTFLNFVVLVTMTIKFLILILRWRLLAWRVGRFAAGGELHWITSIRSSCWGLWRTVCRRGGVCRSLWWVCSSLGDKALPHSPVSTDVPARCEAARAHQSPTDPVRSSQHCMMKYGLTLIISVSHTRYYIINRFLLKHNQESWHPSAPPPSASVTVFCASF